MGDWAACRPCRCSRSSCLLKLSYFGAFTAPAVRRSARWPRASASWPTTCRSIRPCRARTLVGAVSFLTLGRGLHPRVSRSDRRALHDRVARTRVVEAATRLTAVPPGSPLMRRLGVFLATCGYIGYAPVAPGTFGSAAGLLVFVAVRMSGSVAVELGAIVGAVCRRRLERHRSGASLRRRRSGAGRDRRSRRHADHAGVPSGERDWRDRRLPACSACSTSSSRGRRGDSSSLPGGLGVMADDGMAALYGNLVMRWSDLRSRRRDGWCERTLPRASGDHRRRQRTADAVEARHQLAVHHRATQHARHRRRVRRPSSATTARSSRHSIRRRCVALTS